MTREKLTAIIAMYEQGENLFDLLSFLFRNEFRPEIGLTDGGGLIRVTDGNITTTGETVKIAMLRYLNRL